MRRFRLTHFVGILFCLSGTLLFISCTSPGNLEKLTPQAAAPLIWQSNGHFITIGGARIFYLDSQDGRDEAHKVIQSGLKSSPFVLIHGLGASTFSFRRNMDELSNHARVIALDLKGFGLSKQYTNRDMSFRAEAALVIALMDALQIPRATLVGHSLGGSVAALVAAFYPNRVDRLVLIDSATLYITRPFVTRLLHGRLLNGFAYRMRGPTRGRVRQLLLKSYVDRSKVNESDVEGYYFPFTVKNTAESLRLFLTTTNPNNNALFSIIRAPTLILWGRQDKFLDPSVRDFLHRQIKNSQLVILEGAGHAVMEEKPEEVNREILSFIDASRGSEGHAGICKTHGKN